MYKSVEFQLYKQQFQLLPAFTKLTIAETTQGTYRHKPWGKLRKLCVVTYFTKRHSL